MKLLYQKTNNDPFVFDSLSVDYYNQYSNLSGVYVNVSPNKIHYSILDNLYNLSEFKLSQPIEIDNSYILIYLYKHNLKTEPTPNNSWNLIYQYAKQEKQNRMFQSWVNEIKDKRAEQLSVVDYQKLYSNPLMNDIGRRKIKNLGKNALKLFPSISPNLF